MVKNISINFADVADGFEALPEGRYAVVVEEVSLDHGKTEPHNPYLKWTLKVTDGPEEGRKLWTNMVLIEKSLWVLKASLQALGHDFEEESTIAFEIDDETGILLSPEVIGLPACVDVYNEVYKQKTSNRVDVLLPISEYENTPISSGGSTLKLKKKVKPKPQAIQKPVRKPVEPVEEEVEVELVEAEEEEVESVEEEITPVTAAPPKPKQKPKITLK